MVQTSEVNSESSPTQTWTRTGRGPRALRCSPLSSLSHQSGTATAAKPGPSGNPRPRAGTPLPWLPAGGGGGTQGACPWARLVRGLHHLPSNTVGYSGDTDSERHRDRCTAEQLPGHGPLGLTGRGRQGRAGGCLVLGPVSCIPPHPVSSGQQHCWPI